MIRFIVFFMVLTLFSACNQGEKVVVIHPEGFYKEVFHVKDDSIKHGSYIKYYDNGLIADSCGFFEDKIQGERKLYTRQGYLEIIESYEYGDFHGPYKTFYPNGQLKKVQQYQQNKIQGEVRQYYEDGTLKAIVQFEDNYENGPFKEYHENGNLHWEGFYRDGDYEQDTLKEFDHNGMLIRKLYCERGICQTVWTPEKGYMEQKKIFDD